MKIKLLTTFIALALLVTVGGVYATWSYASGESGITALSTVTKNNITHGVQNTADKVGTITIAEETGSILSVTVSEMEGRDTNSNGTIDDSEKFDKNADGIPDDVDNYIPVLTASGQIVVTFTPKSTAPAEYKDGVSLTCELVAAEGSAFEFATTTLTLDADSETNYGIAYTFDSATGVCTWTIEGDDLGINLVAAYEDKAITTYVDYQNFLSAVAKLLELKLSLDIE